MPQRKTAEFQKGETLRYEIRLRRQSKTRTLKTEGCGTPVVSTISRVGHPPGINACFLILQFEIPMRH
jgi:hypothetical protein